MTVLRRNTFVWLGLCGLAFVNGALREVVIKRVLVDPQAHQVSVLTAILIFSAYVSLVWKKTKITNRVQAAWIGVYWFVLTVLFETFVLNRWTGHLSWQEILQTYNVARGELWPLVLIWIGLLPSLLMRMRPVR